MMGNNITETKENFLQMTNEVIEYLDIKPLEDYAHIEHFMKTIEEFQGETFGGLCVTTELLLNDITSGSKSTQLLQTERFKNRVENILEHLK